MAAYEAQKDYGFDLGQQLAEKAVGELSYEIDTEIVQLLDNTAGTAQTDLTWSRTCPIGVSVRDHYAEFPVLVEKARNIVYKRTRRFSPNYMVISSDVLSILSVLEAWKPASTEHINGPFLAGSLNGMKVFVSPELADGRFLCGVNGDDYMSSVAVYAPYMACVPTQLLQYSDGLTSQGLTNATLKIA